MRGAESLEPGSVLGVDRLMTGVRPPAVPRVGHRQAKDASVRNPYQRCTIAAGEAIAALGAPHRPDQVEWFGGGWWQFGDPDGIDIAAHSAPRRILRLTRGGASMRAITAVTVRPAQESSETSMWVH